VKLQRRDRVREFGRRMAKENHEKLVCLGFMLIRKLIMFKFH